MINQYFQETVAVGQKEFEAPTGNLIYSEILITWMFEKAEVFFFSPFVERFTSSHSTLEVLWQKKKRQFLSWEVLFPFIYSLTEMNPLNWQKYKW